MSDTQNVDFRKMAVEASRDTKTFWLGEAIAKHAYLAGLRRGAQIADIECRAMRCEADDFSGHDDKAHFYNLAAHVDRVREAIARDAASIEEDGK